MAFTLDNFVRSTLQADITAGATTATVTKAAPPLRDPPAATVDAPGLLILQDVPTSPTKIEVISYTGRSIVGTVVTLTGVVRGLEGSTASPWSAGVPTFGGLTTGVIADLQTQLTGKEPVVTVGTTAQYRRGDKTWRDFATDVRAAAITGLSTATNAAITAADTVLSALGKLQAQLSGKLDATGTATAATKLATARAISLGGLLGGSASFDGSGNVTIMATMANDALSIANTSGLQDALNASAALGSGNTFLAFSQVIDTASGGIWQINVSGVAIGGIRANATTMMVFGNGQPIALRPNGGGSTSGQMLIGTDGSVSVAGALTIGSGKKISKVTLSSAAPGTLADGELYLQY